MMTIKGTGRAYSGLFLFLIITICLNDISAQSNNRSLQKGVESDLVSYWTFDTDQKGFINDLAQDLNDPLSGNPEIVGGIKGKALKFDGFRTFALRKNMDSDKLGGSFTIESWIAPASYPWSWCPVVDCSDQGLRGFFFGIGSSGQLLFRIAAGNRYYELVSDEAIPLGEWSHIAAVFNPDLRAAIYLNGEEISSINITGSYVPPRYGSLSIGRNNNSQLWNEYQLSTPDTYFYFDGIFDEITISTGAKSSTEIKKNIASMGDIPVPELSERGNFPKGQQGSGSFGAFYTKLDYYSEWDDMWRVSDKPDVFVRFEGSPVQLVFWRGASFVPCWVSENDIWYTNEWLETWGGDVVSCAEPIMDRHCRYSHVRIIENTDARVVVHWRYALSDAIYNIAAVSDDGRGEWCDEYHIIYPDNVGVRLMELHYSVPERKHDWLEQIVLTSPGDHPDDLIHRSAISLANMEGEVKNYTWNEDLEIEMPEPAGANISLVNLKAENKPFIIIPDGPVSTVEGKWDSPFFRTYAAHMASGYRPDPVPSVYGWWNHWPVAQVPGDGRWITTNDRPGHFNLTTFVQWNDYTKTEKTRTRIMLQGMTDLDAKDLVPLAESWLEAPGMEILSTGYRGGGFEMSERAYLIDKTAKDEGPLKVRLKGSKLTPLRDFAIVVKDWGRRKVTVKANGRQLVEKLDFSQGIVSGAEGSMLIVWVSSDIKKELNLEISGIN